MSKTSPSAVCTVYMGQEIRTTTYYETMLWRLRNCYEDLRDAVEYLKGEPGTETVIEELQDGMLAVQMGYERWANFLVTDHKIALAPDPLYECEQEETGNPDETDVVLVEGEKDRVVLIEEAEELKV